MFGVIDDGVDVYLYGIIILGASITCRSVSYPRSIRVNQALHTSSQGDVGKKPLIFLICSTSTLALAVTWKLHGGLWCVYGVGVGAEREAEVNILIGGGVCNAPHR